MSAFNLDPTTLSRELPVMFEGPAGAIEGLWRPSPPGRETRGVAVVAHPHPAHGGTMLNKVVFHTARVLNHDLAVETLRFNFRGVGASEGAHDEGRGELEDLRAAWTEARRRTPQGPFLAAGFSFGAAMTLALAAREEAPVPGGLALIGLPFRLFAPPAPPPRVPLAAVHGSRDQYTPPERVREYLKTWPDRAAFHVIPGADHFLDGHLPEATEFLSRTLGGWLLA
jgi:alpha/beta superfamily hydrolase